MKYAIILVIFLQGCSTAISKGVNLRPEIDQSGHIYSGMSHWASFPCGVSMLADGFKSEKTSDVISSTIMLPFYALFVVIDLPLSFVADTLMVPIDLMSEATQERKTIDYYCEKEESKRSARITHNQQLQRTP
jgi:uncharacterized protein YceK